MKLNPVRYQKACEQLNGAMEQCQILIEGYIDRGNEENAQAVQNIKNAFKGMYDSIEIEWPSKIKNN